MSDVMHVFGSEGWVNVNADGTIEDRDGYEHIERFDVEEYLRHYGTFHNTDILLIGFWSAGGLYDAPERDFMHEVARVVEESYYADLDDEEERIEAEKRLTNTSNEIGNEVAKRFRL